MKGLKRESVFQTYHVDGTYYWLISVFNKDLKKKKVQFANIGYLAS